MLHKTVGRKVLPLISVLVLLLVVQTGGASAQRDVWTSDESEGVPSSQDIFLTYLEVVGHLDTNAYDPYPETVYELQETIIVPVDGSSVSSTTTLEIGVVYQIRALGTFFVGGPGDMLGDAEYAQFNDPPSSLQNHCGGDPNDVDLGIGINDNLIDNEKVPFWGDYAPSHVYAINFVGEGSPINLNYHDCSYIDNSGSLTVEVWRPVVTTWHIATHGSDVTGDGSEANPFATIQHGIDVASDGDTVLANPGVYRENINFNGKNITVGSLFTTTANDDYILQTVIDGDRNGHVVAFVDGETAAARLTGFTISNGYAHGAPGTSAVHGGGIHCDSSAPTLTNLRITDNEALIGGGGLYFGNCSPMLRHLVITNNHAGDDGGGIMYAYSSADLENVVVAHNSARNGGAGVFFYWTDGLVKNALIADNIDIAQSGNRGGGGAMFDGSSPTLVNVTVAGNRTTGSGGGLNVSFMSQPTLVNSIVWGNTPEQIVFDQNWMGMAITVEHSDIEGGQAGIITHGLGPVNWGEGNLDTSPRFVHAGLGNYRLADNSPVIGAGRTVGAPNADIEGNPRPNPTGSNPDMGAYENTRGLPVQETKVYLPLVYGSFQSPASAGSLYFAAGDVLYQMNLDGINLQTVASGLASNRNQSLYADPLGNTIYANGWDPQAQIKILDASTGVLTEFSDGPGSGGTGLAVDPAGHTLFEGLYYDGVYALDMNNGSWTQLVDSDDLYPMHGQRGQLQIDPNQRQIYFRTSYNGSCGECRYIWRVGFDGDGLTQIVTANGGDAMALDLSERKMYFSDMPGEGTIKWAYMEPGSSKETLFTLPEPYRYCRSIHLDLVNRKMYLNLYDEYSGYRDRAIARLNMDGTGFEILHTLTGNDWLDIHGEMALLLPAPPPPPLLVRYDFEDDFLVSGTVLDRSGYGHHAQVMGEVAAADGISGGQGISLDGNGYVQAASNPAAGKTDITFSLWFKTDQPGENYKLASAAWWNWDLRASGWIIGTHIPEFWSDDENGLYLPGIVNNDNPFLAGAWNHEVITYDGSHIKEYTNGQLINDWPTTGAAIGAGLPMAVGAWPMFSGYNFQGSLDEFAIYDRSLTQQEVQALYAQGR